jgi:hypothetical protein
MLLIVSGFAYGLGGMLKGRHGPSAPSPLSRRLVPRHLPGQSTAEGLQRRAI